MTYVGGASSITIPIANVANVDPVLNRTNEAIAMVFSNGNGGGSGGGNNNSSNGSNGERNTPRGNSTDDAVDDSTDLKEAADI